MALPRDAEVNAAGGSRRVTSRRMRPSLVGIVAQPNVRA